MRANRKVCFVCGAGHSGSTLLGLILGSHPDAFYLGEATKTRFLGDGAKPLRKRVCKLCGPACPVWSDFRVAAKPDLYEQLSRRTGRPLLIDTTKGLAWLKARTEELERLEAAISLVFLQRDGRAVVNSRMRKYPDREPGAIIDSWREQIGASRAFFDSFRGPKSKVRYEALALAPEATIRELCSAIAWPFEPTMLDYAAFEHHPLGGNSGTQSLVARGRGDAGMLATQGQSVPRYYQSHPGDIRLDLRWQREIDPLVLERFEAMASDENADMRWDPPPDSADPTGDGSESIVVSGTDEETPS